MGAPTTFARLVRAYRLRARLTQAALASRTGLSERAIRDLEQGRVSRPRAASTRRLADALDLSAAEREALLDLDETMAAGDLSIGVLGPLTVHRGRSPVLLGGPQQRLVLGLLALTPGHEHSPDSLAEQLWPNRRPPNWRQALNVHISQIRRRLAAGRGAVVVFAPGGYRLALPPDAVDASRFRALTAAAERQDGTRAALDLYQQALDLWRGAVLEGEPGRLPTHPATVALHRARLSATLAYADLALRHGRFRGLEARLRALIHEEPLHDGLHARLVRTLAATGDRAGAIRAFLAARDRLDDELGVEPSAELRKAHLAVIRTGVRPTPARPSPTSAVVVPAQLPAAPTPWAGRASELTHLAGSLAAEQPVLVGISGMGGVGKSALAARAAHDARAGFPDGQLYADLRGATTTPADPLDVLRGFLTALGAEAGSLPSTLEDRSALFRGLCAGRHVLVVLDDAGDECAVRPLLPGTETCAVLVTARRDLPALDGATWIALGALDPGSAAELVRRVVASATNEPLDAAVVAEVTRLCARLPLALRIAAIRLAARTPDAARWTVDALRDETRRLDALAGGDVAVRSSLALSYQALPDTDAQAFRLLGLPDVPHFAPWLAAAVLDATEEPAAELLARLAQNQLLERHGDTRYRFHDLVRLFAREAAAAADPPDVRQAAFDRALGSYVRRATQADLRHPMRVLTAQPVAPPPAAAPEPLAWFEAEEACLLPAVLQCAGSGGTVAAWQLANAFLTHCQVRGLATQGRQAQHVALRAAEAAGDRLGQAVARRDLALLEGMSGGGDIGRASEHAAAAADLFATLDNPDGHADALFLVSYVHHRRGEMAQAIETGERALALARTARDARAVPNLLHHVGWLHRSKGDLGRALEHLRAGIGLARAGGYARLLSWSLIATAITCRDTGRDAEAVPLLTEALDQARRFTLRGETGSILAHLASALVDDNARARACALEGVAIAREIGLVMNEATALRVLATVDRRDGDLGAARSGLVEADATYRRTDHVVGRAETQKLLGDVCWDLGDEAAARAAWTAARDLYTDLGNEREAARLAARAAPPADVHRT